MSKNLNEQPIIIKRIKKAEHAHHGGAWKIAYADFVTAMMAFFLLMWLINATSQEQKHGIANYFDPMSMGTKGGGGAGVMAGKTLAAEEESIESTLGTTVITPNRPADKGRGGEGLDTPLTKEELMEEAAFEKEQEQFKNIKENLEKSVKENPELKELIKNLIIDETPEGLRIQIIDQNDQAMFPSGSSQMYDHTRKLMQQVANVILNIPNKVSISGHTDANPYRTKNYSNWELSSDRANASRRVLEEDGINATRFASVVGKESKEHFNTKDPLSAQNRRISIILLRQQQKPKTLKEETIKENKP
jgi:chemotaxis protein MotB